MSIIISEEIHKARALRAELGIGAEDTVNIFEILKYIEKISIIKMPFSEKEDGTINLSGMIIKKGETKAVVINSYMSLGRQIFTAAHEYYHLKYDDNLEDHSPKNESKADEFASHFLMPQTALQNVIYKRLTEQNKKKLNIVDILYLENYFKLSHIAMLYRLKQEKYITNNEYDELKKVDIVEMALKYGYSTELYKRTKEELHIESNYVELAEAALENDKISNGKYEEYMIAGGYENIIYGFEEISKEDYEDEFKNNI